MLGEEGHGFKIAMGVLDAGRIGIASQAIGIGRAAYEATLAYVRERKAFGQPIGTFQMTQAKIADMKCKLDGALLLTLRAAWLKGQGQSASPPRPPIAKLTASEAAMWIAHQAVQIHARHGLFEGNADRALLPRREDHRDLRGHQRDPAPGDRPQRNRPALIARLQQD